MADVIASHARDRVQALYEGHLALGIVLDLFMNSASKRDIDDMIFMVDYILDPLKTVMDDLLVSLQEGSSDAA